MKTSNIYGVYKYKYPLLHIFWKYLEKNSLIPSKAVNIQQVFGYSKYRDGKYFWSIQIKTDMV